MPPIASRAACVAAAASLLAVAGCDEPTAVRAELVGRWTSGRTAHAPTGTMETTLRFDRRGGFVSEWRAYGIYAGQRPDELSGWTRTEGTVEHAGDRATFRVETITTWDRFHGPDSRPHVQRPVQPATTYGGARLQIVGATLVIDYLSYPLDAPEPTRAVFVRDD